ncbi:MAG TPA: CBS domain-containing protein [Candidatus Omnitrophota bacterium]|nr:CBS domain-containing protein [Candidatus Omnitrophota bacterium]HPD84681.1 CBS domain-containing protein [Candidatus Omnitrophota bacterium]HRZ03539.1 CBS domain-containing protein [Candidatus Omnitrophota bacterium]
MTPTVEERISEKLKRIKVKNIMTRSVITMREDETLSSLADLLIRTKISGAPVLNGVGEMTGIVTITDLLNLMGKIKDGSFVHDNQSLRKDLSVKAVMTKNVSTIAEEATLLDAVNMMCTKKIHTLPVVKEGALIGVLGRRDVIMYFYAAVRESIEEINR